MPHCIPIQGMLSAGLPKGLVSGIEKQWLIVG
jgi:hypothetical protein